jgi:transcriptional regulator with XRE-family HTH domain
MKKEAFLKALGQRIRKTRDAKSVSLYRLAKNMKKTPGDLLRIEKGEISVSLYYLSEIAKGLDVTIEELVKGLP